MIYSLVLAPGPFKICSRHRRNSRWNTKAPTLRVANPLFLVNRQIYQEVASIFYGNTTWLVGNGKWGSTTVTNVHALRAFISQVPARHLALIKSVIFQIHTRASGASGGVLSLGTALDASALHTICRALVKHFPGIKTLDCRFTEEGDQVDHSGSIWKCVPRLSQDETAVVLHRIGKILVGLRSNIIAGKMSSLDGFTAEMIVRSKDSSALMGWLLGQVEGSLETVETPF